ncbi:MAG: hypothetical protein ACRYFS_08085 [Janthinobacterium lividum]
MTVSQADLDQWRAFTEQTRTDLLTLRHLIASGQTVAADQLIGSAMHQTLIAGRSLDDAGANRPTHLPPRPAPGTYQDEDLDGE